MLYPEALLHPEVKPLDEGFCSLLLTLAQCPSIQQSALVTKQSEAILLDVAHVHLRLVFFNPTASASH